MPAPPNLNRATRLIRQAIHFARDPATQSVNVVSRLAPELFFRQHVRKASALGLNRVYFLMSFDCDIEQDIDVIAGIHDKLTAMGIQPIYAVPGELLEQGAHVYRK